MSTRDLLANRATSSGRTTAPRGSHAHDRINRLVGAHNRLREAHNGTVDYTERLTVEARAAFAAVRDEATRENHYTFNRLATRIDELTWALVHAGILPAHELHSTVHDYSDQWGGIPGCPCGTCPADHVEDCRCLDCRNAAEDAAFRSPEAVEQRRLIREFCEQADEDAVPPVPAVPHV